jgi:nitroreductase
MQMDVFDAIKARRSVRKFEQRPIPEEVLSRILEAGRLAPSASNRQPWHFVVVKDLERKKRLSEGRYAHFLTETPVVVAGCGDAEKSPRWYAVDVTIALQQMVLAATELGVGTCWIGSFDEEPVRNCLKVPENFRVVAMLAIGYPADKLDLAALLTKSKSRAAIEEITSEEEFGNPRK